MNESLIPLNRIGIGETVKIKVLLTTGAMRRRLQDIGLTNGAYVKCLLKSPSLDPAAFLIRGAVIAIRSEDSSQILTERVLSA